METREIRKALGERAFWGRVGYSGEAHAPAAGTYASIGDRLSFATIADSGRPASGGDITNLYALLAAAIYEAAFAAEAGPLSTWSN